MFRKYLLATAAALLTTSTAAFAASGGDVPAKLNHDRTAVNKDHTGPWSWTSG